MLKVHHVDPKFIAENISAFYQQSSSNQGFMFPVRDGEWSMDKPQELEGSGTDTVAALICSVEKPQLSELSASNLLGFIFSLLPFCSLVTSTGFTVTLLLSEPASCHYANVQTHSPLMSSIL